jgi:glycosyltransferase involved in cell wall biosynthesis
MNKAPHICFVAPTAYPALAGDESIKMIGGAQIQQTIIAKELVARGYRVSMICMDHGQPSPVDIGGVTVHKAYGPDDGLPMLRFIWPRLTSIWRCMTQADADIYYYRAAGMLAGVIAAYAKLRGKKSIYAVAGNPDLEPNTNRIKYKRDRLLFEYGLRNVDQILVQNDYQRELCIHNYHREPVLINNCWPYRPAASRPPTGKYVLWVSMMRKLKQPHLFIELARALPQYHFKMIGGHKTQELRLFESVKKAAEEVPNLDFLGYVPLARTDELFDGARLFVNTSESEGFPNTFLQAWCRGVPTVSFVDCGARGGTGPIGLVVDSLDAMRDAVNRLMEDERQWSILSEASSRYFVSHHAPSTVIPQYEAVIESLLSPRHAARQGEQAR